MSSSVRALSAKQSLSVRPSAGKVVPNLHYMAIIKSVKVIWTT